MCTKKLRSSLRLILPHNATPGALPWEDAADWAGLPTLLEEQLARLGQTGTGAGGRGAETAVPYDGAASRALAALRAALASAVLSIGETGGWPDDRGSEVTQLTSMARWLLERLQRIRGHADAARISTDIRRAVGYGMRLVDQGEPPSYLGQCDLCGNPLWSSAGSPDTRCGRCQAVIDDAPARRGKLLDQAEAGLATRDVILDAAPSTYGVIIKDSTFAGWVKRGRLQPRGEAPDGAKLWKVGEVLDLARERDRKRNR